MVKNKPKRWKGCCYMCKGDGGDKRQSFHRHTPFRVVRQMGKKRRIKRNYVPDE